MKDRKTGNLIFFSLIIFLYLFLPFKSKSIFFVKFKEE